MEDLKRLEGLLSSEPFRIQTSVIELDSKSDSQFDQLIQRVISIMDPSLSGADLNDFLTLVECPGEARVRKITILIWICENFSQISRSIEIGNICAKVQVPDEFFFSVSDREVAELVTKLSTSQSELRFMHKDWLATESHSRRIRSTETEIQSLVNDRTALADKIEKLRVKMTTVENFNNVVQQVKTTRKLNHEITRLQKTEDDLNQLVSSLRISINKQSIEIELLDELSSNHNHLHQLRSSYTELGVKSLDEIRELESFRERLGNLEARKTVSEKDLLVLEREILEYESSLDQLKKNLESIESDSNLNEKMLMYYQQFRVACERRDTGNSELEQAESLRKRSLNRLRREEMEFEQRNGSRFISETELGDFVKVVRAQGLEYKRSKTLLQESQAEVEILKNTLKILTKELNDISASPTSPVESLANIQNMAERLNQEKESALEEISALVLELSKKLKNKRAIIGPKLLELKEKRHSLDSLREDFQHQTLAVERSLAPIKAVISDREEEIGETMLKLDHVRNEIADIEEKMTRTSQLCELDDLGEEIRNLEFEIRTKEQEHRFLSKKLIELESKSLKSIEDLRRDFSIVESIIQRMI
jgi:chromosome segregation ATPase